MSSQGCQIDVKSSCGAEVLIIYCNTHKYEQCNAMFTMFTVHFHEQSFFNAIASKHDNGYRRGRGMEI